MSPGGNGRNQGPSGLIRSAPQGCRTGTRVRSPSFNCLTPAPTATTRPTPTHDGRQPWPIAMAAADHQQLIGEASCAITTSSAAGAPTSGTSTALATSAGLLNVSIWIAFMAG